MKLQLIRNATLKLDYGGHTLLLDPCLAPKHAIESYAGRSRNPTVDLPMSTDEILNDVELVIVSHLHQDHFEDVAKAILPKDLPLYCQPGDEAEIGGAGFTNIIPLTDRAVWKGITLTRREGSHGLGKVLDDMGTVIGFSLAAPGEPSIYWAGDTVLYPPVLRQIRETKPDIIVTHSCGARWNGDLIVMDAEETVDVCKNAGDAIVIATHMEALDHATIDRAELRRCAEAHGISPSKLLIPVDGQILTFDGGR